MKNKMKNKFDWNKILHVLLVIICAVILGLMAFLKVWVIIEYGDMPISEVPSWAIPWLTNFGR